MVPFIDLQDSNPDKKLVAEFYKGDYRVHQLLDGCFLIFKDVDEEPSYEIDSRFGCNCPAATYRAATCKHEKMAGFVRGESEAEEAKDLSFDELVQPGKEYREKHDPNETKDLLEDLLED